MNPSSPSNYVAGETTGPSYLIISFRYIGDVLVTTPLVASIKQAIPDAVVDYLVFEGTEGVLKKNPHIRNIITAPRDKKNIRILMTLFKKYDVAIAAYPSDRTAIAATVAGKSALGLSYHRYSDWWKKFFLKPHLDCDNRLHIVQDIVALLPPLGIPPLPNVIMGYDNADVEVANALIPSTPFVVFHPYSRNRSKYWPAEYWGRLANLVDSRTNCTVIFTRTPGSDDTSYLSEILKTAPDSAQVLPQVCTLPQLAAVIKNCRAYVGIDTAVTHIAACLDVPTVGIFGSSISRHWAPWSNGVTDPSPFRRNKGIQHNQSVTVVQKDWECVPCNKEHCRISTANRMECLAGILPEEVFGELDKKLHV